MAVGKTEEIVTTVKAILKTLECPICLELLKIPVSAGCGHFFCRQCISGILQSTYRAPCPLCKRSFTRRSVQEAKQRLYVISAAEALAETCSRLTGVKLVSHDISIKEYDKSDVIHPSPKKVTSSNQENQDKTTRKRKSCENDNEKSTAQENIPEKNNDGSPSKRTCPGSESEDSDDEDLPDIEDVLREISFSQQARSSLNKTTVEEPVFVPEETSKVKTHLDARRTNQENPTTHSVSTLKMSTDISGEKTEQEKKILSTKVVAREEEKNKINALKNKTNKVNAEQKLNMKVKSLTGNTEVGMKSKENALSPSKSLKIKRKSRLRALRDFSKINESNSKLDAGKDDAVKKSTDFISEDNTKNECYTLNQITLFHSKDNDNNVEDTCKKSVDDPFKAIGLNDTAVSVDTVTSPLSATKNISIHKSPGWSRVKKVQKDFKMKQFTLLNVEKNSPNTTIKNTSVSDQETMSDISKSNHSMTLDMKNKTGNQSSSKLDDASSVITAKPVSLNREECEKVVSNSTETSQVNQQITETNEIAESTLDEPDQSNFPSQEMDCTVEEQETVTKCTERNSVSSNTISKVTDVNIVPSVSITSSSVICAKYSDDPHKISSQNILKTQKLFRELRKTPPSLNKLRNISGHGLEKDMVNAGKKLSYDNVAEMKQGPFSLPSHIEEYQNFHAQGEDFQYVEQSQQTSQVFNVDFQNPLCDNLRAMVPFQPPQFLYPPAEKTKVIKRTCLTLDEIQECFAKSTLNGSSETLYSVPFLSGQYKLHVGVSDETLNVSVLKVIDPSSETNLATNAVSLLSNKCIQATNSLFFPNEAVPPSDDGSEMSHPDSVDPFPYLSKNSLDCKTSNFPSEISNKIDLAESTYQEKTNHILEGEVSSDCKHVKDDATVDVRNCEENENLNLSEIVHFPPVQSNKDNPVQEVLNPCEIENQVLNHQDPVSMPEVNNLLTKECRKSDTILSESVSCKTGRGLVDCESSDEEEPFRKLKECVQKEPVVAGKKLSRLSLKKKSPFRRIRKAESSDESDQEMSIHVTMQEEETETGMVSEPEKCSNLAPAVDTFKSPKLLNRFEDKKKGVCGSAVADMPSTFASSMLSEDPSQANASEILLEIEDLSDKIKSLEEKLKFCGHGEDMKLNQSSSSMNGGSPNKSDSEDSTDLFPQSVSPTPPNFL